MSIKTLLEGMSARAFDLHYDQHIKENYEDWVAQNYQEEECEYDAAVPILAANLSDEHKAALKTMEENYQLNRHYAARYGFKAGIFSGFNQYFSGTVAADDGFYATMDKDFMTMPGMERHHQSFTRNEENLKISEELRQALEDELHEHLTSIECAWGQRIHSAACHAFYLGYRAALEIIDAVDSLGGGRMIGATLYLEHKFGYIASYEELELREARAANQ